MGRFVVSSDLEPFVFLFYLQEFKMPHDIVESRDGSVFVGDAGSKSVFKFTTESKFIFIKIMLQTINCCNKIHNNVCKVLNYGLSCHYYADEQCYYLVYITDFIFIF